MTRKRFSLRLARKVSCLKLRSRQPTWWSGRSWLGSRAGKYSGGLALAAAPVAQSGHKFQSCPAPPLDCATGGGPFAPKSRLCSSDRGSPEPGKSSSSEDDCLEPTDLQSSSMVTPRWCMAAAAWCRSAGGSRFSMLRGSPGKPPAKSG